MDRSGTQEVGEPGDPDGALRRQHLRSVLESVPTGLTILCWHGAGGSSADYAARLPHASPSTERQSLASAKRPRKWPIEAAPGAPCLYPQRPALSNHSARPAAGRMASRPRAVSPAMSAGGRPCCRPFSPGASTDRRAARHGSWQPCSSSAICRARPCSNRVVPAWPDAGRRAGRPPTRRAMSLSAPFQHGTSRHR